MILSTQYRRRFSLLCAMATLGIPKCLLAGGALSLVTPHVEPNIKLVRSVVAGVSSNVSVKSIGGGNYLVLSDITVEGRCAEGSQLTKLRLLGDDEHYHSGRAYFGPGPSREIRVQQPARTKQVPIADVPGTKTMYLRSMCAQQNGGTGTITVAWSRYFDMTCGMPGATGPHYTDKDIEVEALLTVTCEDVMATNEVPAKVTIGEMEYECPQLTEEQPRHGDYFEHYRIVVSGTPYGHFLSEPIPNGQQLRCIRTKANTNENAYGLEYTQVGVQ